MRIETRLEWEELKGRMNNWLYSNKFYVRKPYI